jgi:hypothetical protein
VSGWDGTLLRTLKTDTAGQPIPANASTADADGVSNTVAAPTGAAGGNLYLRTRPQLFDGTTWNREYTCNNRTPITLAAGTDVVIATGVAAKQVRICHVSFSSNTGADVTFRQGTGTTCSTATVALTGAYVSLLTTALDFGPFSSLTTSVAASDVCLHFSAAVTTGGVAIYAQF